MNVCVIQSCWRSYKIRQKVKLFSKLPDDLWQQILLFIRKQMCIFSNINRVINVRASRLYYTSPLHLMKNKIQTLQLVRKYYIYLSEDTKYKCFVLCMRLLRYNSSDKLINLMINASLEVLLNDMDMLVNHIDML